MRYSFFSIILACLFSILPSKPSEAALTTGVLSNSIGYLSPCTAATPVDLYNGGTPILYLCGGAGGVPITPVNTVILFFKYVSSDANTGFVCYPQFKEQKFLTSGGSPIWTDPVGFTLNDGIATIKPFVINVEKSLSVDASFAIPVAYDGFRISCQGYTGDLPADGIPAAPNDIAAPGDTLAVSVRATMTP